jgi:hypothetical protein
MTRIKQGENLRFSVFIRGEKLFCSPIAEFGINPKSEIWIPPQSPVAESGSRKTE